MKKKIIIVMLLAVLTVTLAGCASKTIDSKGIERYVSYGLIEVETLNDGGRTTVAYDPRTMICYLKVSGGYHFGISPYYIIGEDGKPEIAVYGVNYPNSAVNAFGSSREKRH